MRWLKNNWFIFAAVFLFFAYFLFDKPDESQMMPPEKILAEEPDISALEEDKGSQLIKVDIKGAVANPGIYEMETEQRVDDLIKKAGGLKKDADSDQVNLALKLTDEMVIHVPEEGEIVSASGSPSSLEKDGSDSKVNLNNATLEEVMTLNGIGAKKAEAILAYREENGPFAQPEDLLEVSGIGEKTLENIKDLIQVP